MNKTRFLLSAWMMMLTFAANAQQSIERLLPKLQQMTTIDFTEIIDKGTSLRQGISTHSFQLNRVPVDRLPVDIIDTLTSAFEHELPIATESDRYQKHGEKGDTLSYTLAYNGRINPAGVTARLTMLNHQYSLDTQIAAALDIENGTLNFSYFKARATTADETMGEEGAAELSRLFDNLAHSPGVKVIPVAYDIDNGNRNGDWDYSNDYYGFVHRKGRRIEVALAEADSVFNNLRAAIEQVSRTNQLFSSHLSRDEVSIVFGKHWSGDTFCLRRLKDGRVFFLHVEKPDKPCDLAIPYNWHEVDRITRLKK